MCTAGLRSWVKKYLTENKKEILKMISYASYENYTELLSQGFALVDFYSESCGPCKILAKILEDISDELPFVDIVKVNLTNFPQIGEDNDIEAVPTVLFVKDGEILDREVGLMERDEIMEKIGQHYYG